MQRSRGCSLDILGNLRCSLRQALCRKGKGIWDRESLSLLVSWLLSLSYRLLYRESRLCDGYLVFVLRSEGNDGPGVGESLELCSHSSVYTLCEDAAGVFGKLKNIFGYFIPK